MLSEPSAHAASDRSTHLWRRVAGPALSVFRRVFSTRSRLLLLLAVITSTYALGIALIPPHSKFVHAWADMGWALVHFWVACECFATRGKESNHRSAYILLTVQNLISVLALIFWAYQELAKGLFSPFPTIADTAFLAYTPIYALALFFLTGGGRNRFFSLRHFGDFGLSIATMLFGGVLIYFGPSVDSGLPLRTLAVAVAYPILSLASLAFGLLAWWQQPPGPRQRIIAIHLGALTLHAVAYTLYGVAIMTRRYEVGHVLDPVWFGGCIAMVWAAREDRKLPEQPEGPPPQLAPATLDALLPAIAFATAALVCGVYRHEFARMPLGILAGAGLLFVLSLSMRGIAVMRLEHELRDEIRRRELKLVQSQKMEAVATLAGGLAHDFNNLLTGILGSVDVLRLEEHGKAEEAELCDVIEQSALRASDLTRRLITLSKRREPIKGAVSIPKLFSRVASLLRSSIPSTVRIAVVDPVEELRVWADEGELEQALLNLGLNAAKAMPKGGTIRLTATAERRVLDLAGSTLEESVVIRMGDEGCGIPTAFQSRIFEPFFTTRPAGEGSGLGLAMVYSIVQEHGGRIRFDSIEGEGTTFEMVLPRTREGTPAPIEHLQGDWVLSAPGNETVLIVDDRDPPLLAAKVILETAGYEVQIATRGSEALDLWCRFPAIQVLLTDSVMPGIRGHELLVALRAAGFAGPAILMTSYQEESAGDSEGFAAIVVKPFSAHTLSSAVRFALDQGDQGPARLFQR